MHKTNQDMTARLFEWRQKVVVDHLKPVEQCDYIMRTHLDPYDQIQYCFYSI